MMNGLFSCSQTVLLRGAAFFTKKHSFCRALFFLIFALAALLGVFAPQTAGAESFYTGDGGRAIRLALLEPEGKNLGADNWIPAYIQGVLSADFSKYSAITVIDRQNMDKVLAEQRISKTGTYTEKEYAKIGAVTSANHILAGNISKSSAAQYSLQLTVSHAETGARKASFTVNTTPEKLLDAAALNQAAADLLGQLGVNLTEAAKAALEPAQSEQAVNAQMNLAKGIEAMKKGTVVEALSYFIQSANSDPSLAEAVNRMNSTRAEVSSGSIGVDTRSETAWRKAWTARLAECDKFVADYVKNTPLASYLVYSTDLQQGDIDIDKNTIPISFDIGLLPDKNWPVPITGVVDAVYAGLAETGQAAAWGLDWPAKNASGGASQVTPNITVKYNVAVQLLDEQGAVIGTQTVPLSAGWAIIFRDKKESAEKSQTSVTVKFPAVSADKITEDFTIKIASLDGANVTNTAKKNKISILTAENYMKTQTGRSYKTGDTGPAGGIMLCTVFSMLEVAPASTEFKATWSNAIARCKSLKVNGIAGWHLPTKEEFDAMYQQLHKQGLGGFSNSWYWSSSEGNNNCAWFQDFGTGYQYYLLKRNEYSVRAVRAF
ncbi:MAG: DUF1566 domain-containing protein [Treponema sp.]|jgi:hypothetical protein|nr:DUF1566 domain-containing protein [Treponema sp.]